MGVGGWRRTHKKRGAGAGGGPCGPRPPALWRRPPPAPPSGHHAWDDFGGDGSRCTETRPLPAGGGVWTGCVWGGRGRSGARAFFFSFVFIVPPQAFAPPPSPLPPFHKHTEQDTYKRKRKGHLFVFQRQRERERITCARRLSPVPPFSPPPPSPLCFFCRLRDRYTSRPQHLSHDKRKWSLWGRGWKQKKPLPSLFVWINLVVFFPLSLSLSILRTTRQTPPATPARPSP